MSAPNSVHSTAPVPAVATASVSEPRSVRQLLLRAWTDAGVDKVPRLAAALAFYAAFSIAPILVIALGIAGLIYGDDAAAGELQSQLQNYLGSAGAKGVEELVARARTPTSGVLATVTGLILLLIGASSLLTELKDAMNTIWNVPPPPHAGFRGLLVDRVWSLVCVAGIGILLIASFALTNILGNLHALLGQYVNFPQIAGRLVGEFSSFLIVTSFVAMAFKVLPDVHVAWRDVWIGAAATAILLILGKSLFGLYLKHAALTSSYGAVASLVIVLLWTYYSAQILLLGGEFTQAYSEMYGSRSSGPRLDAK